MKTKKISGIALFILIVAGLIWAYNYLSTPKLPFVDADGKINGSYSIASIMALKKPFQCRFNRGDGNSQIKGTLNTDGENIFGEFRILSPELANKEFNSYLIVKDGSSYSWTSLAPIGYKSGIAKSASRNASPSEQAQLIGTKDVLTYECVPWQNVDSTIFDAPSWVTFSEIK